MIEFGENKGDMWSISYFTVEKREISDEESQRFLDLSTREMSQTFNPPPGLSPDDYANLFLQHFLKSRESSREILKTNSVSKIRNTEIFQVGNEECLKHLSKIESSPDFHSWENPDFVLFFRNLSLKFL